MLYTNPKYDKSDEVLASMGYKAGSKSNGAGDSKSGSDGKSTQGGGTEDRK